MNNRVLKRREQPFFVSFPSEKLPSSFDLRSVDTDGDGMHNIRLDSSVDIYAGGTTFMATNSYAAGIGPVCESRGTEFEYRCKEGKITKETAPDGTEYDYCYDRNDDWTMDGNHRFKQDYILKESYLLPQTVISTYDLDTMTVSCTYQEEAITAIKEQLMKKRAVMIGFQADTARPWEGGDGKYLNVDTWAHYTWEAVGSNHAVTIIGWDDNYSSSNFLPEHQPPADGAWLVRNSWGSGTNEFPDLNGFPS